MIGFGQEKEIFLIQDTRINEANIECFFLEELCVNIKDGIGLSFYNTGEKKIEVSCQNKIDFWFPLEVINYYKNGNKESSQLYYGCETSSGQYTTWWENGNLKYKSHPDEIYTEDWYENGQRKHYYETAGDAWGPSCITKEVTYYNNGNIRSLFVCEDCDIWEEWNNCAPKKCFSITEERIKCPKSEGDK